MLILFKDLRPSLDGFSNVDSGRARRDFPRDPGTPLAEGRTKFAPVVKIKGKLIERRNQSFRDYRFALCTHGGFFSSRRKVHSSLLSAPSDPAVARSSGKTTLAESRDRPEVASVYNVLSGRERHERVCGEEENPPFFFWRCWSLLSTNSGRPANRPPTVLKVV